MPRLIAKLSLQIMGCLFSFLVVDPDDILQPCCGKVASIMGVIQGKDLIIWLNSMPDLFASLGKKLEEVPIGVGSHNHCSHRLDLLRVRPPPDSVHRRIVLRLLVFHVCVDFSYLGVLEEVVDPHIPVTGSDSYQGVLGGELSNHDLAFFFYRGFDC